MRKLQAIIRREFVERVRTRAFVISTVLFPTLWGGMIYFQATVMSRQTRTNNVVIVDGGGGPLGQRVEAAMREAQLGKGAEAHPKYIVARIPADGRLQEVKDSLVRLVGLRGDSVGHLDGILVLSDTSLTTGAIQYLGSNVASPAEMESLEDVLQPVLLTARLVRENVDPKIVERVSGRVKLDKQKVTEGRETGESGTTSFLVAYIMGFILYIALLMYGIQVMGSVLEEKTSRIIEVLASSLTPFELMLGKVIGVGSVGLFQLAIWVGSAFLITTNLGSVLGMMHASPEAAADIPVPSIGPGLAVVFLLFFGLGFFLYASLYAAVGAMCNSQQDTQQANTPVTMGIVVGFMTMFPLLNEPNGTLGRILSLVPFTAPFATPIRYSISPLPLGEVLLSVAATTTGMLAVVWLASRIYRVGILAYGKKPSLRELARWVRTA